jgi:hypothetical protein
MMMETAVNSAAAAVASAINSATPTINLAVPDVKLHAPVEISFQFSDAFIDDVQVNTRVVPTDTAPVHTRGVVTVPNGYTIDFDSGHIGRGEIPVVIWPCVDRGGATTRTGVRSHVRAHVAVRVRRVVPSGDLSTTTRRPRFR